MDLQNSLIELGFTEYEAKVYLALLADNPATGYQISKKSGVPRSMVYEVLSRLHTRGAVLETHEARATLYRPLPPAILLDRHEEEVRKLLGTLRPGLDELFSSPKDERTWSIKGRQGVLAYAQQMLQKAEHEVFLVLNDADLEALRPTLEAVDQRGIPVSVLLTGQDTLPFGQVTHHPPLESEMHGLTHTLLLIIDNDEALVGSSTRENSAAITNNANLVLIARQFIWMEFFTQRIFSRLGPELLERLDPADREIFNSISAHNEKE